VNVQKASAWIQFLEEEWSKPSGFLGRLREGVFVLESANSFLAKLKHIDLSKEDAVNKRLVSLLWYIPGFLGWQVERVAEQGADLQAFHKFRNEVQSALEEILGVP
jgi:hypothetical protein